MTDSLVPVAVACPCLGTPHSDGDTVFLAPFLSLRGGLLAEAMMVRSWQKQESTGKILRQTEASLAVEASLREVYVSDGVKEWTFLDAEGEAIEVNEQTIRDLLLNNYGLARPVGDKTDDLYTASVLDPLLARLRKSSRTTRTNASTSPSASSSAKRPRPLKPSSTTTSDKEQRSA